MSPGYGDSRFQGLEPFGRYSREKSATAGMLCLFGFINLVPGVFDLSLSTIDGQDWSGNSDVYPPVVLHLAALIQVIFSIVSIASGFQYLVCGAGSSFSAMLSFMSSLFSFFSFAVAVSYISFRSAKESADFIPAQYGPSTSENRSVASMAVISYIAYAANNFLALIYLNYKMFMFELKGWSRFNRCFYKKSLFFFGMLTLLAGAVHLALGAYVFDKVGTDWLTSPVGVRFLSGPLLLTYSRLAMAFGAFQTLLGFWIMWRSIQNPSDVDGQNACGLKVFQLAAWFVLVYSISSQVLAQVTTSSTGRADVEALSGFAAQAVAYVVGLGLFPIYLDAMYYTTPESIAANHLSKDGSAPRAKGTSDIEERKVEGQLNPPGNPAKMDGSFQPRGRVSRSSLKVS